MDDVVDQALFRFDHLGDAVPDVLGMDLVEHREDLRRDVRRSERDRLLA